MALPGGVAVLAMLLGRVIPLGSAAWDVAWTAAAVAALAGMLLARASAEAAHRARWTWWAAAGACWLVGQLAWDAFELVGSPSSPNLADLGWWAFAVLVVTGLLRVPGGSRGGRLVAVVEALPLIFAAVALTLSQLWADAAASSLPRAAMMSALVYPVVYVSAAVLTLQAMVGGALSRLRAVGSMLVLAGMIAQATAFVVWGEQLLAIGAGGALAARRPESSAALDEPGRRGGLLPAATFLLLVGALVRAGFSSPPQGARLTLAASVLFCGAALIVRGVLLARRLRALLARERSWSRDLEAREADLARLNERLVEDSRRDPLTGMRNRRALAEDTPELEGAAGESLALALCDVDHFKAYNDHLGHLAGDQALRALAAIVRGELRAGDAAYRYGGEELLLVLRDATAREALAIAERVRAAVAAAAMPHPAAPDGIVTVSIGVAAGPADTAALLARADAALYTAKGAGRNRVRAAGEAADAAAPARPRASEEPVVRHLGGVLAVSRAAAAGEGEMPVLEALAHALRSELRFQTVAVNLLDEGREHIRVAVVLGDEEVRAALLGTVNPWSEWEPLMDSEHERCGAIWLPAGSHEWSSETTIWTPLAAAAPGADAWDPEDMLLLPLRGADGEVLGVVSVDQPLSGRRPDDAELTVLMAVADHAGLALERVRRDGAQTTAMLERSQELRLAAVMLLAETLDLRDAGTAEHSRTVGLLARDTAVALGLAADRVERVHAAGVLHDLGKLGIADAILHKPTSLDDAEWREMQRHPEIGARILEHAGLADIAAWVRAHHERIDGCGYPSRLPADRIPLEARVLAVADAYEAMIANRPYRAGMPAEAARAELQRCRGTQFDPQVVAAFLSAIDGPTVPALAAA